MMVVAFLAVIINDNENPSNLELEAADVNEDNVLDVLDIVLIINIILSE